MKKRLCPGLAKDYWFPTLLTSDDCLPIIIDSDGEVLNQFYAIIVTRYEAT